MGDYKVYMHVNKINDKKYIGITCQKVEYRWAKGNGYKGQERFYRAITKYGWNNFEHIVLFENLTKEEAEQKEIELISKFRTTESDFGYNITSGGGSHRFIVTQEWLEKIKGKTAWNLGVPQTKETKNKISDALKQKWTTDEFKKNHKENYKNGMSGKKHNDVSINKMIEAKKRKMTPIYKFDLEGKLVDEYVSLMECSRINNLDFSGVRACCLGEMNTYKKNIFIYKKEYNEELLLKRVLKAKKKVGG